MRNKIISKYILISLYVVAIALLGYEMRDMEWESKYGASLVIILLTWALIKLFK